MDKPISEQGLTNLTELAYSKYCAEYSKDNYLFNEPLFNQMSNKRQTFWREFIIGVLSGFKKEEKGFDVYKATAELQKAK